MGDLLVIKTDLKETNFLEYVLEEFRRINLAKFTIKVVSIDSQAFFENEIYYTNKAIDKVSIFNALMPKPDGNIEYLKEDLYILKATENNNFNFKYDVFWNAFVFLSRYEEQFKNTASYSIKHIRNDRESFYIPIVNVLFNEFEGFIKQNFKSLKFKNRAVPVVDLSHDVDYINKTWQLRFKQTILNSVNIFRDYKNFLNNTKRMLQFLFSNPSYWCFDYWVDLEKGFKKKSTFYIYVKHGKKTLKELLIDPSYDVASNKKLRVKLQELQKKGFEIGLHGSYKSALDYEQLKKEKQILESILKTKVTKTRQHWLNYNENITPYSHSKLFEYDSSLGWNNQVGFRSGIASLYRPYNFKDKKAFNYFEIPQVIMDSNIFDYNEKKDLALDIFKNAKETPKTAYFSISWHQRVCNSDYKWNSFYKELLNAI